MSATCAEYLAGTSYGWGENVGWVTVVTEGQNAARVHDDYLSGFLGGESVGWIHLGHGAPANGVRYSNTSANDYGVNRNGLSLSGYAWGENIGWINFAPGDGGVSLSGSSLDGMAWSESCGWITFASVQLVISQPGGNIELPDAETTFTVSWVSTLSDPPNISYVVLLADTDRNLHNGGHFLLRSPLPSEGSIELTSATISNRIPVPTPLYGLRSYPNEI